MRSTNSKCGALVLAVVFMLTSGSVSVATPLIEEAGAYDADDRGSATVSLSYTAGTPMKIETVEFRTYSDNACATGTASNSVTAVESGGHTLSNGANSLSIRGDSLRTILNEKGLLAGTEAISFRFIDEALRFNQTGNNSCGCFDITCDGSTCTFNPTSFDAGSMTDTTEACEFPGFWRTEAYLKAPNVGAQDYFGEAVAISGDTIVVGAKGEASNETTITNGTTASSNNSASGAGAVYVFWNSSGSAMNWVQQAYLKAPNSQSNDMFGVSVAISGDTIAVGATGEDSNQTTITNGTGASTNNDLSGSGAVYVFKRESGSWAQEAYLKAPNSDIGDSFGISVSVDADTIVVGANSESSNQTTITNGTGASSDDSLTAAGAAYVFKRTGTDWAQEAYLKASNSDELDVFGSSVAVSGETVAVGASYEDSNETTITNGTGSSSNDSVENSGAVYVYKRTGANWAQEAYLKPPNTDSGDAFGAAVSISGDTIIVGAVGESSTQTTITNGTGASSNNTFGSAGAAYVFKRTGASWAQEAYLKAPNSGSSDYFGSSVSVSGDYAVVAAPSEDSNGSSVVNGTSITIDNSTADSGAAYVFKRTGTNWAHEAYIKAYNRGVEDYVTSVAISGTTVAVGAYCEDSNQSTITNGKTASDNNSLSNAGAAYIYHRK